MVFFSKKEEPAAPSNPLVDQIKQRTSQELATADVSELVNNMTKSCFDLCLDSYGTQTSGSQTKCTQNCAQKFMTAWGVTSTEYVTRLQQQQLQQ